MLKMIWKRFRKAGFVYFVRGYCKGVYYKCRIFKLIVKIDVSNGWVWSTGSNMSEPGVTKIQKSAFDVFLICMGDCFWMQYYKATLLRRRTIRKHFADFCPERNIWLLSRDGLTKLKIWAWCNRKRFLSKNCTVYLVRYTSKLSVLTD